MLPRDDIPNIRPEGNNKYKSYQNAEGIANAAEIQAIKHGWDVVKEREWCGRNGKKEPHAYVGRLNMPSMSTVTQ